jgi:hypothetical protein
LLSLDAPTVAALWCWAFGRAARQHLAPWLPLALALGAWLFYVADRLLDARTAPAAELKERHRFHHRHRRLFLTMAVPVLVTLCVFITWMPRSLLAADAVLGALSLLYLAAVHLRLFRSRRYYSKELVVALLFSAASALPGWDEARRVAAGMPRHHPLLLLCPLFALLCWLNCMAIEDWEHRRSGGRVAVVAALAAGAACVCFFALGNATARQLALCAGLSAVLFLGINRSRLVAERRRIAADLALLTPLLLLLAPA